MEFLRDPIWEGIAAIVAIVTAIVAVIFFLFPSLRPTIRELFVNYYKYLLTLLAAVVLFTFGYTIGFRNSGRNLEDNVMGDIGNTQSDIPSVDVISPIITDNVAYYSFEECPRELNDWVLKAGNGMACSSDYKYDGEQSLVIDASLAPRENYDNSYGTAQLEFKEAIVEDQLLVMRVFVPQSASEQIYAGLYLWDGGKWEDGHTLNLVPGQWTTLAWATPNAAPWQQPAEIGVIFSIAEWPLENEAYDGPIYVDLVEMYRLPIRYQNPVDQILTNENLAYSFESEAELASWHIADAAETETLQRSVEHAFDGRYALQIGTDLYLDPESAENRDTKVTLAHNNLQDKMVVSRLFVPDDAPVNLAAQYFLENESGQRTWGQFTPLEPGKWATLAWHTEDAPPWDNAATLGIELKMQPIERPQPNEISYQDPVYLDLVEILEVGDVVNSLESAMVPWKVYHFEDVTELPPGIEAVADAAGNRLTEDPLLVRGEEHLPYGLRSLRVNVDLQPYKNETGFGGLSFDLGEEYIPIDAILANVYIPPRDDIDGTENFYVTITADSRETVTDNQSGNEKELAKGYYSHHMQIPVGEWTPLFWGTGYANGRCTEEDESGNCADGATFLWDEWAAPEINRLTIRIWRDGEAYKGPIYLDHIALYQLTEPQE